jgi:hypothetical protein
MSVNPAETTVVLYGMLPKDKTATLVNLVKKEVATTEYTLAQFHEEAEQFQKDGKQFELYMYAIIDGFQDEIAKLKEEKGKNQDVNTGLLAENDKLKKENDKLQNDIATLQYVHATLPQRYSDAIDHVFQKKLEDAVKALKTSEDKYNKAEQARNEAEEKCKTFEETTMRRLKREKWMDEQVEADLIGFQEALKKAEKALKISDDKYKKVEEDRKITWGMCKKAEESRTETEVKCEMRTWMVNGLQKALKETEEALKISEDKCNKAEEARSTSQTAEVMCQTAPAACKTWLMENPFEGAEVHTEPHLWTF